MLPAFQAPTIRLVALAPLRIFRPARTVPCDYSSL